VIAGGTSSPTYVSDLRLTDFRCYDQAELRFSPGVTVITGANAQGKTSLLEAVAWAARGRSFRGVPDAALVRVGADRAILRAAVRDGERERWLEAELNARGRNRVRLDHQAVTRTRELRSLLLVSVFGPDDLQLVKDGPAFRRGYLDELLVMNAPRYEATCADYDRVLRHRNALLKGGLRGDDAGSTLAVFDAQLARTGADLLRGRLRLLEQLEPAIRAAYSELAGPETAVAACYETTWTDAGLRSDDDLEAAIQRALVGRQRAELDRGMTLVGPHRDEWRLLLDDLDSRTYASQGEQRTLALALRLGGHRMTTEIAGTAPVLLLDDVFSELDGRRAAALTAHLTAGQTLVTTAGNMPDGVHADQVFAVADGRVAIAA
jgi:DNA replication and repair protein RecF